MCVCVCVCVCVVHYFQNAMLSHALNRLILLLFLRFLFSFILYLLYNM